MKHEIIEAMRGLKGRVPEVDGSYEIDADVDRVGVRPERLEDEPPFLLQFFTYAHLPLYLGEVSKPFADSAHQLVRTLPKNPARDDALHQLLLAKDAAVRARVAVQTVIQAAGCEVVREGDEVMVRISRERAGTREVSALRCLRCGGVLMAPHDRLQQVSLCRTCSQPHLLQGGATWIGAIRCA